ncbi:MAG: hypothetical protein IPK50_22060 [Fibrobacterota bacterium]|nr:hypothetical protein [Fibrobacterota bacterium]QQS04931.1 MAG: hypothetical protein IPK50_22060 [Fibrobacterota bacterium]
MRSVLLAVLLSGSLAPADLGGELLPIPVAFISPETGPGGGAKLRWQDPLDKPGFADLTGYLTVRSQWNVDAEILRDSLFGLWRLGATAEVGEFPAKWYGLGNPPPDEMESEYTPRYLGSEFSVGRWLPAGWRVGGRFQAEEWRIQAQDRGAFRAATWSGQKGGLEANAGMELVFEGRDLPTNPTEGMYAKSAVTVGLPIGDFLWQNLVLDLSMTKSAGSFTGVVRIRHDEAWGGVPFWRVPSLGHKRYLRGVPDRRLRGEVAECIGSEARWNGPKVQGFPLQPALFAELGRAGGHADVWREEMNPAAGGGLRVPLAGGKAVVRVDYGWSFYGSGLYVDFGQAF